MKFTYTAGSRFDDSLRICASKLKGWGYFDPGVFKSGTITWSQRGEKTGCILLTSNMRVSQPYIELSYTASGEQISYQVFLQAVPSNLGKGMIWYFMCPISGKRCRILYGIGNGFLHRNAFQRCFYEKQVYSKKTRFIGKLADLAFGADKAYDKTHKKHFRKNYRGKPTQQYAKLIKQITISKCISPEMAEKLLFL